MSYYVYVPNHSVLWYSNSGPATTSSLVHRRDRTHCIIHSPYAPIVSFIAVASHMYVLAKQPCNEGPGNEQRWSTGRSTIKWFVGSESDQQFFKEVFAHHSNSVICHSPWIISSLIHRSAGTSNIICIGRTNIDSTGETKDLANII